jgi:hypothetical protein
VRDFAVPHAIRSITVAVRNEAFRSRDSYGAVGGRPLALQTTL